VTNRERLIALAEECERAEGPSRELDRKIFEAATGLSASYQALGFSGKSVTRHMDTPRYSASIDAALTLVPADLWWLQNLIERRSSIIFAGETHAPLGGFNCALQHVDGGRLTSGFAKTPALALCAAALKARARAEGEE